ncbi:hypothetical protein ACKWTF_002463 [Chironomus riparius]
MGKKNEKSRGKLSQNKRNELKILSDAILLKSREMSNDPNHEFEIYNEIYNLLERIIKVESEVKLPFKSSRSEKTIENFIDWCANEGAKFDKIELKNIPDYGLGLVSKKSLKEGEIFIVIPDNMIFSYSKIENSIPDVLKQKIFSDCPLSENMSNVKLALALMIERMNSQSKFKPYFDVLPNKFSTVLYYTPTEMKELQGTLAFTSALKQVKYIIAQYAFLYKYIMVATNENDSVMEELRDNFTYEFYRWAVSCVMTRQNIIPKNDDINESVLIPAWDMANHTNGDINTQFNNETHQIESFSMKNFQVGEQVTIAYGNRSNLDFLIHNGFVFKENTNTDLFVKLNLNKSDPLFEDRLLLLKRIGLNDHQNYKISPELSDELLGFIRVFNMSEEQLTDWLKAEEIDVKDLLKQNLDFGKSFEIKIFQSLLIRVKILLKLYPTQLNDDIALLNSGNLSKIKLMLVQYRVIEKTILVNVESSLQNKLKQLNGY